MARSKGPVMMVGTFRSTHGSGGGARDHRSCLRAGQWRGATGERVRSGDRRGRHRPGDLRSLQADPRQPRAAPGRRSSLAPPASRLVGGSGNDVLCEVRRRRRRRRKWRTTSTAVTDPTCCKARKRQRPARRRRGVPTNCPVAAAMTRCATARSTTPGRAATRSRRRRRSTSPRRARAMRRRDHRGLPRQGYDQRMRAENTSLNIYDSPSCGTAQQPNADGPRHSGSGVTYFCDRQGCYDAYPWADEFSAYWACSTSTPSTSPATTRTSSCPE